MYWRFFYRPCCDVPCNFNFIYVLIFLQPRGVLLKVNYNKQTTIKKIKARRREHQIQYHLKNMFLNQMDEFSFPLLSWLAKRATTPQLFLSLTPPRIKYLPKNTNIWTVSWKDHFFGVVRDNIKRPILFKFGESLIRARKVIASFLILITEYATWKKNIIKSVSTGAYPGFSLGGGKGERSEPNPGVRGRSPRRGSRGRSPLMGGLRGAQPPLGLMLSRTVKTRFKTGPSTAPSTSRGDLE